MQAIEKTKEYSKAIGDAIMSDTPKWAKVVRLISLGLTSLGGTLMMTNPVTAPAGIALLIPYAGYITFIGSFSATFVQFFGKK